MSSEPQCPRSESMFCWWIRVRPDSDRITTEQLDRQCLKLIKLIKIKRVDGTKIRSKTSRIYLFTSLETLVLLPNCAAAFKQNYSLRERGQGVLTAPWWWAVIMLSISSDGTEAEVKACSDIFISTSFRFGLCTRSVAAIVHVLNVHVVTLQLPSH